MTTVDTVYLGNCANGRPVWFDRAAYEADLIVPINRVKLHTDFVGPIQSGLCKMLVTALGNHKGCSAVHEEAPEVFAGAEETARLICKKLPSALASPSSKTPYAQDVRRRSCPRGASGRAGKGVGPNRQGQYALHHAG